MTDLRTRIAAFIRGARDEDFSSLALDLWQWQVTHNPDYRALCGATVPTRVEDIPVVPVRLFRDLALTCFPPDEASVVFRTSGTTGGRGVVRLRDTSLYDLGARAHAEAIVGPLPRGGASLVAQLDDSSLAHMCWDFAPELQPFFHRDRGVDGAGLVAHLNQLTAAGQPAFVPGTAFAFAELVEQVNTPVSLLPGSTVMVTGGFKGRKARVSEQALRDALAALFPGAQLVGEYGMSELSSQLWSRQLGEAFVPPPWLRVLAVDPDTGAPTRTGLLRFVDLASVDTALAIETGDRGEVLEDGRVVLHGRHPGAPVRGCSLTVEEALRPPAPPPPPQLAPRPYGAGPQATDDEARIPRVLAALERLRGQDPGPLSQGLAPASAAVGLKAAIDAVTAEGLRAALATQGSRPPDVTVVVAWGVFTSPIEWVALFAAAGCRVHLKAPSRGPDLCACLAEAFAQQGLPVTASADRTLGEPSAVVAFGSDEGVLDVVAATPNAQHTRFGHRFSVALFSGDPRAVAALARDHALYDTRGCMAPAAIFCLGDPEAFTQDLLAVLPQVEETLPAGAPVPGLGPELRRRRALAAATGQARLAGDWEVHQLPAEHFVPTALPRVCTVVPVADLAEVERILLPWRPWLSSLAADLSGIEDRDLPTLRRLQAAFPRVVAPGKLQEPTFPRLHDGIDMLGAILERGQT